MRFNLNHRNMKRRHDRCLIIILIHTSLVVYSMCITSESKFKDPGHDDVSDHETPGKSSINGSFHSNPEITSEVDSGTYVIIN